MPRTTHHSQELFSPKASRWSWEPRIQKENKISTQLYRKQCINIYKAQWLNGHEFEQALGVADGQGSLACCSPWGPEESDTTEQLKWERNRATADECPQDCVSHPGGGGEESYSVRVISLWSFFWLADGDVIWSQHHQISASNRSGVYRRVDFIQFTPGEGFSTCKTAQRTWLRILSIAFEEELKILDFNG